MLRTILSAAPRRLSTSGLALPLRANTNSLSSGALRGLVANNNAQNLSVTLPKVLAPQYQMIRQTSSESSGKNPTPSERIDKMIKDSPKKVFLFMKGVPEAPQCGYSNAVVQILDAYGVKYDSFDVLSDEEIRKEIKTYSNWPTIPQVYVDKTFVGGCDILIQMHQNNELEQLFESKTKAA